MMTPNCDATSAENQRRQYSIEALTGAVLCCNDAFHITHVNTAACSTFRAAKQDLVGKHFDLINELPIDKDVPSEGPEPPRFLKKLDGSTFFALIREVQIGAISAIQIFDINDLMREHDDLAYRESTWRYAIEAAEHGI